MRLFSLSLFPCNFFVDIVFVREQALMFLVDFHPSRPFRLKVRFGYEWGGG